MPSAWRCTASASKFAVVAHEVYSASRALFSSAAARADALYALRVYSSCLSLRVLYRAHRSGGLCGGGSELGTEVFHSKGYSSSAST